MKREIFQNGRSHHIANPSEEVLVEIGSAAAIFAHEVANSLASIHLVVKAIEEVIPRQHQNLLNNLHSEVARATNLLEQFRSLGNLRKLNTVSVDLVEAVHRALECHIPFWAKRRIQTIIRFPDKLVLHGDKDKVQQIIVNLCKNAVESMPTGGRLTLTGYGKDNTIIFEVNDTGCGIPPGIDIFKMFTTTKADGSGLGLYIVRQIVEAHQGTVEYSSDTIQGTTFMVTLPIERTLSS